MSTVLHYVGYDDDAGGIVSVIHGLAEAGRFGVILGLNRHARQTRHPSLAQANFSPLAGEVMSPFNVWHARGTAREVQAWLRADPERIFHGHSRAGLLVALWLNAWGERRVLASVHCYGRQRWFYRWAARRLGGGLHWLSPAMRAYYGLPYAGWEHCVPGGVPRRYFALEPVKPAAGRLRLGGIGARVRWKRWDLVAEAVRSAGLTGVTFEHIGSEPDRIYAAELRAASDESVRWHPAAPDATGFLEGIDVLVCASRQEPFSMAMQEALAAGIPVVAAASGGALDMVRPGKNGWLFRDGDVSDLTAIIRALATTRELESLDRGAVRASAWAASHVAEQWAERYARLT